MTKKAVVSIVRAGSYDANLLRPLVIRCLDLSGGLPAGIKSGARVFVKINHLPPPSVPERAIITHPVFTEAVLEILKETGATIVVGDDIEEEGFDISGYRQMCRRLDVRITNLRDEGFVAKKTGGEVLPEIFVSRLALEADVIINLAKLKTHSLTLFTGGIKNMYGVVPTGLRQCYHGDFPQLDDFARLLVDIFGTVKPQLTLMDGIVAMEGEGPGSGRARKLGLVFGSRDTVALDAVAARTIGIKPGDVLTTSIAAVRGLGVDDLDSIDINGEDWRDISVSDFKLPVSMSRKTMNRLPRFLVKFGVKMISPRPVVSPKQCVACGACEKVCPRGAVKIVDKVALIDYASCIRCMCCHEACRYFAITSRRPPVGQTVFKLLRR